MSNPSDSAVFTLTITGAIPQPLVPLANGRWGFAAFQISQASGNNRFVLKGDALHLLRSTGAGQPRYSPAGFEFDIASPSGGPTYTPVCVAWYQVASPPARGGRRRRVAAKPLADPSAIFTDLVIGSACVAFTDGGDSGTYRTGNNQYEFIIVLNGSDGTNLLLDPGIVHDDIDGTDGSRLPRSALVRRRK